MTTLAKNRSVDVSTVSRAFKKDSGMKSYNLHTRHVLSKKMKVNRLENRRKIQND